MSTGHISSAPHRVSEEVHEVFSGPQEQVVLSQLLDRDEPVPLDELAEHVAEEVGVDSEDGRQHIAISLHHVYLPKLDDGGFVDYDAERRTVTVTGHGETVYQYVVLASYYQ